MSNFIRVTADGEEYAINVNYIVKVANYAGRNHAIIIAILLGSRPIL